MVLPYYLNFGQILNFSQKVLHHYLCLLLGHIPKPQFRDKTDPSVNLTQLLSQFAHLIASPEQHQIPSFELKIEFVLQITPHYLLHSQHLNKPSTVLKILQKIALSLPTRHYPLENQRSRL